MAHITQYDFYNFFMGGGGTGGGGRGHLGSASILYLDFILQHFMLVFISCFLWEEQGRAAYTNAISEAIKLHTLMQYLKPSNCIR